MRILPLAEVKAKLKQLVADIAATDEAVTITKNGHATAVLMSYDKFEGWQETLAVMAGQELVKEIHKGMKQLKQERGKLLTDLDLLEELEKRADITEALKVLDDPNAEFIPRQQAKEELKP